MIDEDKGIDADSVNPENQHFEKMTAGQILAKVDLEMVLKCRTCCNAPKQVVIQ